MYSAACSSPALATRTAIDRTADDTNSIRSNPETGAARPRLAMLQR